MEANKANIRNRLKNYLPVALIFVSESFDSHTGRNGIPLAPR